jgi:hypothetical protein
VVEVQEVLVLEMETRHLFLVQLFLQLSLQAAALVVQYLIVETLEVLVVEEDHGHIIQ